MWFDMLQRELTMVNLKVSLCLTVFTFLLLSSVCGSKDRNPRESGAETPPWAREGFSRDCDHPAGDKFSASIHGDEGGDIYIRDSVELQTQRAEHLLPVGLLFVNSSGFYHLPAVNSTGCVEIMLGPKH